MGSWLTEEPGKIRLGFVFDEYHTHLAAVFYFCVKLWETYVLLHIGCWSSPQIPFDDFSPLFFGCFPYSLHCSHTESQKMGIYGLWDRIFLWGIPWLMCESYGVSSSLAWGRAILGHTFHPRAPGMARLTLPFAGLWAQPWLASSPPPSLPGPSGSTSPIIPCTPVFVSGSAAGEPGPVTPKKQRIPTTLPFKSDIEVGSHDNSHSYHRRRAERSIYHGGNGPSVKESSYNKREREMFQKVWKESLSRERKIIQASPRNLLMKGPFSSRSVYWMSSLLKYPCPRLYFVHATIAKHL